MIRKTVSREEQGRGGVEKTRTEKKNDREHSPLR